MEFVLYLAAAIVVSKLLWFVLTGLVMGIVVLVCTICERSS